MLCYYYLWWLGLNYYQFCDSVYLSKYCGSFQVSQLVLNIGSLSEHPLVDALIVKFDVCEVADYVLYLQFMFVSGIYDSVITSIDKRNTSSPRYSRSFYHHFRLFSVQKMAFVSKNQSFKVSLSFYKQVL
jgi:hypothetical protein